MSWRMAGRVLPLAGLSTAVVVAAAAHAAPAADNGLKVCAAIEPPGERLACYDQLAGRIPPKGASAAPTAPAAASAPAAAASPESFGLSAAEHPHAPTPPPQRSRPRSRDSARVPAAASRCPSKAA